MKITDKIHLVKIDFSVQITPEKALPRFVNSLIIFGEHITVVDSGVKDSYIQIYDYIKQQNRKIEDIKLLILSHSHPDHIGSANKIKADTGCNIIAHLNEQSWIENIDEQYKSRPVPGFYNLVKESVNLDAILIGDEELCLDKDINVRIINTPGHSKGSFCILFKEDRILFTGDSLPVENDIPTYYNFADLKESVKLIKNNIDFKILLSSWTSPLFEKADILALIEDGERYLERLDRAVKQHYSSQEHQKLENCGKVIRTLDLPTTFINPLVDDAFKSH